MAVDYMIMILNYWFPLLNGRTTHIFSVITYAMALLSLPYLIGVCDKEEENILSDEKVKFTHVWLFFNYPIFRVFSLILLFVLFPLYLISAFTDNKGFMIFRIIDRMFFPALTAFSYFIATDPPRPCKGRIREWAESFAAGFKKLAPMKVQY